LDDLDDFNLFDKTMLVEIHVFKSKYKYYFFKYEPQLGNSFIFYWIWEKFPIFKIHLYLDFFFEMRHTNPAQSKKKFLVSEISDLTFFKNGILGVPTDRTTDEMTFFFVLKITLKLRFWFTVCVCACAPYGYIYILGVIVPRWFPCWV